VTRERIRQIEAKALRKLAAPRERAQFQQYDQAQGQHGGGQRRLRDIM
jgi:hypothetical protein